MDNPEEANGEQKELSWEARKYKEFKDSFDTINVATIKEKLRDRTKYPYIKMNTAQKELFDSQNKGQTRFIMTVDHRIAHYQFYISCFMIDIAACFQYRNLPLREGSCSERGSFGEVHFVKNSIGQEVCLKLIRFEDDIQPYFALRDAAKEFGMCKLADLLGVGPRVQSMNIKESYFQDKIVQLDILVYYDGIAFQMEKCELVIDRIVDQPLACCQEELGKIERELGEAMLTLHSVKIVHKDIKPSNTVYSPSKGRYCLIDFGLSHSVKETYEGRTQTNVGGTPGYMSEEMQSLLKTEKRRGKVNLYYNDLHAYRRSLQVIRGYASGERSTLPRIIIDPEDFQITSAELSSNTQELTSTHLFYFKTNQGFSQRVQRLWMDKIREMSSEKQREEKLKRMEKYRRQVESSKQYKFQKKMDRWARRTILGYQFGCQWEDIRALFRELSRPQNGQCDYEEVLRCLMNLRRVNGLIEVRFWKIETLLNDVIFPYIYDKYSQDWCKSIYYQIVQQVINLVDMKTHKQLTEAKYQQELQGVQETVGELIAEYRQQEGLFELLCDLSEFCCHFNICSVLDTTLEYLDLRNPSSPEHAVVLLARCVLELQKHPQKSSSKIVAYIWKICFIVKEQRYREISQLRYSFYQWFLLSIRNIQNQGKLSQEVEYYIYMAGVIQLQFVPSFELYCSLLYSSYLIQSSGNNTPISQYSELYECLCTNLSAQLFLSATQLYDLQVDLQCSDSEQISLIKPMFALLFHFIDSLAPDVINLEFVENVKDSNFTHWLASQLVIGPRCQSQIEGTNLDLKPLLSKMSQEQLRYRAHMHFFPFHQHLVHSKVLKPLFCEADEECERLKERLIEATYNITSWEEVAERMTQHLHPPKQITQQQNLIFLYNNYMRMYLRKNPEYMQNLRSGFYKLIKEVNTRRLGPVTFIFKNYISKAFSEA